MTGHLNLYGVYVPVLLVRLAADASSATP